MLEWVWRKGKLPTLSVGRKLVQPLWKTASQVALVVKNPPASARDGRDVVWSLGRAHPLEGGYGNILALRMPWTEESGGLQSIGLQRVRHEWRDLARTHCVKTAQGFLRKLKIELPDDPAILLLGIYPYKTLIKKDTWLPWWSRG